MKYFLNNKQISEQIPDHLLEIREPTKYFVPAETICPSCSTVFDKQHDVACSSRIKGCPQANYTWSQISRMRRSLEQIKQFEVNSRTKSINSFNSKKITKCQTQFKRDG